MTEGALVMAALLLAADGERADDAVKIKWIRVASTQEATLICLKRFPEWPSTGIGGCYFRADDGVCYVVAPDPAVRILANGRRWYELNQWAELGHEVKHCFDGKFHD